MIRLACVAVIGFCIVHFDHFAAADHAPGQFEHHPDVQLTLFAKEPDVVDPVSLTFAANGDCYVVEMRDYPYGVGPDKKPGGTVRLLRDLDADGRVDESTLFATGLSFPTSIMAWRGGVLVIAPPEIRFLKDTDGDDKADVNQVVLTGLRRSVTDSNANSLRWGFDNMIHVANGGNGGKVKIVGSDQPDLNLGNSDFAFDLDSKTVVKTGRTGGGFGLVFDDFGNSFTTHNLDYLQQRIIPSRYIEQSPEMFSFRATENISDHGVSARIYPIVQAVTRVNHPEQAGHFSSSGGMGILNSKLYSPKLANSIFVCDVVCNIVHRDVLREDGPVFRAARAPEEQTSEFIASRDPAFRPVGLEHGPDSALYLIDMQRNVIEHPDYIPARIREKLDIRAGQDRGRIYRVNPNQEFRRSSVGLPNASTSRLVESLASTSPWHRTTAQRILVENRSPEAPKLIRQLGLLSRSAHARARSLWLLNKFDSLSESEIQESLSDPSPGVRKNAIRVYERRLRRSIGTPDLLIDSLKDRNARVRFQAALSLDGIEHVRKLPSLFDLLMRDGVSNWSRRSVLLSIDDQSRELLMQVWKSNAFQQWTDSEAKHVLIQEVAEVAAATDADQDDGFVEWLRGLRPSEIESELFASLLSGLESGWRRQRSGRLSKDVFSEIAIQWTSNEVAGIEPQILDLISLYETDLPETLANLFIDSRRLATDLEAEEQSRIAAIEILGRDTDAQSFDLLINLLSAPESTQIQKAAIGAIGQMKHSDTGHRLLEIWDAMLPGIRGSVINLLLGRREYQSALLTALEQGTVQFSELNLDLEQRRRLLRWSSAKIGRRAAKLFGDEEYSNRKEVVSEWLAKLPMSGDTSTGREVFTKKCSTCHVVEGKGNRVGPDLQALSHRSVEDLLTHILDPNMSINPNYVSCVVETVDGQIFNGLLSEESADSITLKQAEGKSQTISRDDIQRLKTLKTSLMPEGIEKELTPLQLRSLIAYLQEN